MSLVAPIKDGKVVTNTNSSDSISSSIKTTNSAVDSDTFLTMLVAEMQNQDPLEPTSNTEWVAQYATFTMVEEMDQMCDSLDLMRANELVGKNVVMKVTSSTTGETNYIQGNVDYVVYENGKAYLYINDNPYSIDDLDTVSTQEYMDAYELATEFKTALSNLPSIGNITTAYQTKLQEYIDVYNNMSDYEKGFVSDSYVAALKAYREALEKQGCTFTDTIISEATNDDILAAFNTKMDSLLKLLTEQQNNASTATSQSDTTSVTDTTKVVDDNASDQALAEKESDNKSDEIDDDKLDALTTDPDKTDDSTKEVVNTSNETDTSGSTTDTNNATSGDAKTETSEETHESNSDQNDSSSSKGDSSSETDSSEQGE